MKNIRSLNLITKILVIGILLSSGILGTSFLNNFLKETYIKRRSEIEKNIENLLDKNVDLGEYSGIKFLGFSLGNSKIVDKENINSVIKAKNVYIGIMPIQSFLNQKWIIKISPQQAEMNLVRDFFKGNKPYIKSQKRNESKLNYDLVFNLNKYANLNFNDLGLETKLKGNIIYRSNSNEIIANLKSKLDGKGFLKLKFNTKLNQDFLMLSVFSRGLNLQGSEYNIKNRKFEVKKGNFKSNFKLLKSSSQTFCRGRFGFTKLDIKPYDFSEKINSDSTRFFCKNNNLIGSFENINYGSLTSNFNLNVPLNKSSNIIDLKGSVGFKNSLNPDIKLSGNISYWFDKRGINFGNIDSIFKLNRTKLANLNIFRKNDIDGFITAEGELKGKISNPDISINLNVDNPQYKGIRIKETWEGDIKNYKNEYLLNMKNKYYSTIPTYLSVKFDSSIKLDSLAFRRVFNSDVGLIEINKDKNSYIWSADNFPLDELELSLGNNQFDRISGIINGTGSTTLDQNNLDGRLALSFGKYRNIKLANSLFDFYLKDNSFYVDSSLYPNDGGIIEFEYNSKNNNLVNLEFNNISTSWTILTAFDIFNFENKKVLPTSKFNVLKDLEINKEDNSFREKIAFINKINENNNLAQDKFNLKKYLDKFKSRYNGKVTIQGDRPLNYKLNAKLNGYLDVSREDFKNKNNKEEFSIDLEGGLLRGEGSLIIKKLPLSIANIFLTQSRDLLGGLDMNLFYNLDEKSFRSEISSNNSSIKNNELVINKGSINLNNSTFEIDFPLFINDSEIPIYIKGSIPINNEENLFLRVTGNEKFIDLIDIFSGDYFTFKKGYFNLGIIIKGNLNKPLLNGFILIKDSEIEFYNNIIEDINGRIIFDFDYLEIDEKLEAKGEDSGNISIEGSLPFYSKNNTGKEQINFKTEKLAIKSDNLNTLLDSEFDLSGSFEYPVLGGKVSLNNGFVDIIRKNENKKVDRNTNQKEDKNNWPELFWDPFLKDFTNRLGLFTKETFLNSVFLGETLPNYLDNLSFDNLMLKLGPEFKLQFSESVQAYLETVFDLRINGTVGKDLRARGLINLEKGRANLLLTPFKLNKNKENYILFAERSGVVPYINFSLVSKVPDTIIPIRENIQVPNISGDLDSDATSNGFGTIGIGNSRLIKIEASYEGFLDQLSFEDENKKIQLRSTPSYSRSQIIGLIGGNSANLVNRAFISQINNADAFNEKFQLSLYPALIENNDSLNNIFSNENLDVDNGEQSTSNEEFSTQAWVAQLGYDLSDAINFAFQTVPGRDDIPSTGIFTFQVTPNLELLGSYDANGDWKSQIQIFRRFNF